MDDRLSLVKLGKAHAGITKKILGNFTPKENPLDLLASLHPLFSTLKAIGLEPQGLSNFNIMMAQHGSEVVITRGEAGGRIYLGDAIIFKGPGITTYFPGGCPTVCFRDDSANLTGIIHAGWRSISQLIIPKFIADWVCESGTARNTKITLLPNIGPCCLSYRQEAFRKEILPELERSSFLRPEEYAKPGGQGVRLNLSRIIQATLGNLGYYIPPFPEDCICCSGDYHCYRCDDQNGQKYRNAAFVLAPPQL